MSQPTTKGTKPKNPTMKRQVIATERTSPKELKKADAPAEVPAEATPETPNAD